MTQKSLTKKFFDSTVKEYYAHYSTMPSAIECADIIFAMINHTFPPEKHLRILDVGCGPGYLAEVLSAKGHFVVGVDVSDKMIAFATKNARYSAQFFVGDIENLRSMRRRCNGDKPDLAIAKGVFENLEQDEKALDNIHKLLKQKGYLIAEFRHAKFKQGDPSYVDPYPMKRRVHNPEKLRLIAEKQGFKLKDLRFYHYHKGLSIPEAASAFVCLFQKVP